jgi:hypothetical protein
MNYVIAKQYEVQFGMYRNLYLSNESGYVEDLDNARLFDSESQAIRFIHQTGIVGKRYMIIPIVIR